MSKILNLTQAIRHSPGIENAKWPWNLLRQPYHRFLNLSAKGVSITIDGYDFVRIPSKLCGTANWELYEPESIKAIVNWLKEHPSVLFLDIGCASRKVTTKPLASIANHCTSTSFAKLWSFRKRCSRIPEIYWISD